MDKPADTRHPVHDLIRRRWSPLAFSERAVEREKLTSILEAARWAPSSFNEQPWAYLLATRDDRANFDRLLGCLVEGNVTWAQHAPVLLLSAAKLTFDRNGQPNRHAWHDVGAATAFLTIEATDLGLYVHQMAGILPAKARTTFGIPDAFEPVAAAAVGYPGDPAGLPENLRQRQLAPRARKELASCVFTGHWGQPSPVVSS
jgi:nitroreductase